MLEILKLIKTGASRREERYAALNRHRQRLRGSGLKIANDEMLNPR
jgi:hypothetical protein